MKSKERRSPGRSSRYDDYDRDSRRRRSRSRSYDRYRSRSPSYDRHRRRSESPREWVFSFSHLSVQTCSSQLLYLNVSSSALVDGWMQEEEAGAARTTGTTSLTLFRGCGLHPLLSLCLGHGNVWPGSNCITVQIHLEFCWVSRSLDNHRSV